MTTSARDLVLGCSLVPIVGPDGVADVTLAVAVARAGGLAVVDVAGPAQLGPTASAMAARTDRPFAIRPGPGLAAAGPPDPAGLAATMTTVLLGAVDGAPHHDLTDDDLTDDDLAERIGRWGDRRVLVEITSRDQARRAVAAGADGLVAKGCESGGWVGTTESFVLLQQTVDLGVPVWARGGIGRHTAAGAIAVGAAGVVLDSQLALVRESGLPAATRAAVAAMDGSETRLVGGHRVYTRPDLAVADRDPHEDPSRTAADLGPDVGVDLVPVGQDAALAGELADRHETAGGVVDAIRTAIGAHLDGAARGRPLGPGGGVAVSHATRYPIVQGPMTRVSDRAAFAAAVADAGGMPFLALALMRSDEVEPLLAETAERLGDRPWGVGVLGFVPAELRDEQLGVIRQVRPPVALIAGGRPSQAAPLEADGIATYLHVPSPGLLDRFVKDGARRFVFEGRECGGHVGPRPSFPLWDAQVERLLAVPDPENLHVLFAGGIHDARSAACVATIGAPLAQAGAHLGVLMGTAYLFTQEAVTSGAITPAFQEMARACERTVLLETSPGHATRCVDTDYVRLFADTKARLVTQGAPADAMWAELETLNLGRLRVASKGVTRGPDGLVALDEAAQRRDGMFMIGQVASLRDQVTTMAELHAQVSEGATATTTAAAAAHRPAELGSDRVPPPLDVAIVGMASLFPGSVSTEDFWTMVVDGVNAIREVDPARWNAELYFDPEAGTVGAGRKTPSKWGGFLSAIGFDPLAYGIPPTSLAAIEPVQLLSLEVATRALADAGYATREFDRSRASVVFGAENGNDLSGAYGMRALLPQLFGHVPDELDAYLPALTEDSFPGVLTNVIAGRIANRLDLGGMNFTVDAACAASLAAVDAACKELLAGNSDLVLCGGADVHNGINDFLLFSSVHALSPTGQCRTFDAAADGIALGEGIACVVLKRRADAERDGDRIYAVIDAVAGSSDGRHLGLTAPRKEGQQRALERAYAQARRSPASVGLIEAHGTGTVVGDRTELATLTEVFADHDAGIGDCVLGSVKSQIGHTKCAAGLAGLIKASRALYHGVLPPTGNLTEPNPAYDATTSPFRFVDRARPWPGPDRHAGVSAFGFGGANFHAVLSSYDGGDGPAHGVETWPAELFVVRADSPDEAGARLDQLSATVDAIVATDPDGQRHRLRDLAATVSGAGRGPVQVALVATDFRDLADKLVVARSGTARRDGVFLATETLLELRRDLDHPDGGRPRTAFVYPGQGSQRPGMLGELFVTFPRLRGLLALGEPWLDALYPPAAFTPEQRRDQSAAVTDTRAAQPVLGLCGLAMTDLLAATGVVADTTAGHSYGELVALAAAGALDPAALLALSQARGRAIHRAATALGDDPGSMAALSASSDAVQELLGSHPDLVVANHNSPTQVVVSGPTPSIAALIEEASAVGLAAKRLNVACAFHSPMLAAAPADLAESLAAVTVAEPSVTVWSNTTGEPYPAGTDAIRRVVADQVVSPVRFVAQVEAMYAAGVRVFVEAGPGRVLTQLLGAILGDRPHRAIACDVSGEPGVRRFLLAVAELATLGHDIRTDVLFAGRTRPVALADLPVAAPGWTVDGQLVRTAAGAVVPGSLQPADEFPEVHLGPAPADDEQEAVVLDYLRNLREVVAAERDVLLRYLGASGADLDRSDPGDRTTDPRRSPGNGDGDRNGSRHPVDADVEPDPTPPPGAGGAEPGPAVHGDELLAVVLQIVADRTGYPIDMLDPDLDLEADLSIDSIKRIEVIGELAERIDLGAMGDAAIDDDTIEELAQLKSLREIVAWIDGLAPGEAATPAPDESRRGESQPGESQASDAPPVRSSAAAEPVVVSLDREVLDLDATGGPIPAVAARHVLATVELAPASDVGADLAGQHFLIADDTTGLAPAVVHHLTARGATSLVVEAEGPPTAREADALASADGLVWLRAAHPRAALDPGAFDSRAVFAWWRPALLGRATRLLAVTVGSGTFAGPPSHDPPTQDPPALGPAGLGLGGMARTVAREYGDRLVRVVDLDPRSDPDLRAQLVVAELADPDGPVEVGYAGTERRTRVAEARPRPVPADDPRIRLEPGSVVLLTGGARGITARVALALARRFGCHVELAGRSPAPPADPAVDRPALVGDRATLRRALIEAGTLTTPAAIEAECSRLLADQEVRATLGALDAIGVDPTYHQLDVRDGQAVRELVGDITRRRGRLDLVVHGAGVLDDHLVRDKTIEGFDRVFATKVDAARSLLAATDPGTLLVFFGSVSGVFGNRGQVDYSAANDALDELATVATASRPGRALSVDWGPWAGTGMVSVELEREYARRGVGLIDPDDGIEALLAELAAPRAEPAQVVIMRSHPAAMAGTPRARPALQGARP